MEDLTFESHDKLNRKDFAKNITKLIYQEIKLNQEDGLTISLNGSFGSGKSYFLKMWKAQILYEQDLAKDKDKDSDAPRSQDAFKKIILLNAWEEDFCNNPLLSIVTAIVRAYDSVNDKKIINNIKECMKKVGKIGLNITNQVVSKVSGIDVMQAYECIDKKDYIDEHIAHIEQLNSLKQLLSDEFNHDKPALILVDELDRCRPDYAISYIETIKHLFDFPGIAFVLAVDRNQIKATSKNLFGSDINFDDYYLKFVNFEINLPQPDVETIKPYLSQRMEHFFRYSDKNITAVSLFDNMVLHHIASLIIAFNLQPRQVEYTLRLLGYIFSNDSGKKLNVCISLGIFFMAILKKYNPDLYENIGTNNADLNDYVTLFDSFNSLDINDKVFWKTFCIAGSNIVYKNQNNELSDFGTLTNNLSAEGFVKYIESWKQDYFNNIGIHARNNNYFTWISERINHADKLIVN